MFRRVLLAGLASLSVWLTAALYIFGYFEIKDTVEDLAHVLGEKGYTFYPDTRLFGFTVFLLLFTSYFASKVLDVSYGKLVTLLASLFGVAMLLSPEVAAMLA